MRCELCPGVLCEDRETALGPKRVEFYEVNGPDELVFYKDTPVEQCGLREFWTEMEQPEKGTDETTS